MLAPTIEQLVDAKNPVLRQVAAPVTDIQAQVDPHLAGMLIAMHNLNGVGLAAPQIGVSLRFFVSSIPDLQLAINPEITETFGGHVSGREGCLSFPGRQTYVRRAAGIKVTWQDIAGKQHSKALEGLEARIFQHELDHLNGICIFK